VPAPNFLFMSKLPRPSLPHHHSAHRRVSLQLFHSGQIYRPWRRPYASQQMPRFSSATEMWHPRNSAVDANDVDSSVVLVAPVRIGVFRHLPLLSCLPLHVHLCFRKRRISNLVKSAARLYLQYFVERSGIAEKMSTSTRL
jgi:hypothetical protein